MSFPLLFSLSFFFRLCFDLPSVMLEERLLLLLFLFKSLCDFSFEEDDDGLLEVEGSLAPTCAPGLLILLCNSMMSTSSGLSSPSSPISSSPATEPSVFRLLIGADTRSGVLLRLLCLSYFDFFLCERLPFSWPLERLLCFSLFSFTCSSWRSGSSFAW